MSIMLLVRQQTQCRPGMKTSLSLAAVGHLASCPISILDCVWQLFLQPCSPAQHSIASPQTLPSLAPSRSDVNTTSRVHCGAGPAQGLGTHQAPGCLRLVHPTPRTSP
ncbi:hypothetical protein F751_1951 [Auxenochlorella protothecoides]|uniref:Uncharacterized protein n=1 Tax=Auxenochlorella protothecoides TaxID=3075 RepID=A0A087SH68_AUXPR|nr:hypothetical protein F751_1951 [Auxenochlorella protothecoides]KFM25072.1 hypothetical protein F751_1951 [Auxenochlorella protothecoides]